jgi:CDP-diacylglycerol--serine O-phosphatidyltransferase
MGKPKSHSRKGVYLLPNLLTTGALFCGFYAIVAGLNAKFEVAAIAVFVAMILDGLDGRVARMINAQSEFGAEYDSLSDLVSFGLAPALVMYQWALVYMNEVSTAWGKLGWMAAFIYVACAAIRLARFNTQTEVTDKRYFIGLPSPTAAAIMVGMVWVLNDLDVHGKGIQIPALIMTLGAGLLMVSNIKYNSFKELDIKNKVPHTAVIIMVLIFALTAIDPPKVLFGVFLAYTLYSPFLTLVRKIRRKSRED